MYYYEALQLKYLKLGLKKFGYANEKLSRLIEQQEKTFLGNKQIAILGILAGEKYSTFNLIKRESGELVNEDVMIELLTKEIGKKEKDATVVENILFYINYLNIRLKSNFLKRLNAFGKKYPEIDKLLNENSEIDGKKRMGNKCLKSGHFYSAYIYFKYAGLLDKKILNNIADKMSTANRYNELAKLADNEKLKLSKETLTKMGKEAINNNSGTALFFFVKSGDKLNFKKAVMNLYYLSDLANE